MLLVIVTALLLLVSLTLFVIVVAGLLGRVASLRRQIGRAQQRVDAFGRVLARTSPRPAQIRHVAAGPDVP